MELPLSKRDWELYEELKLCFESNGQQEFDEQQYFKYQDWLAMLVLKGVLQEIKAWGTKIYYRTLPFDDFEKWITDQNNKAKHLRKREWVIAIISASAGAVISFLLTLI